MMSPCDDVTTHVHGQDAARHQLPVLPDGEVPGPDPHEVVEGELQDQPALRAHLTTGEEHVSSQLQANTT